ncbi:multicomponent Na+:H+ antiporter subunit D [Lipingzhangella halophila]|uniref:Multicomponent Na+:H+ antiporter subunit D n=1 Tax=Lipingzhangella halophila TaxID=1783352 RepID=A0A7W7RCI9_9ACTN|nr:monovalent cation/H+ antiporter subunit D family protein [Lipingzhangella halophila]MBB4929449.1 multicomponent Na+:H+ antiporter subunit D [Lipingzhangella halophila]
MTGALLPLTVAVPLLAAAVLAMVRGTRFPRRAMLVAVLIALLAGNASLAGVVRDGRVLAHDVGSWPGGIAISFAVDLFSALMLTATALVTLVCVAFAAATDVGRNRFFGPLVLVLYGGVCGALLTADLFNLFVFVEVMLAPSYVLISVFGRSSRIAAGRLYAVVNLLGSTVLLIGIAAVYGLAGTVNLGDLAGSGRESPAMAVAAGVVLIAFLVKAAAFPVYGWLPNTYPNTSPAVAALFSGLHTKVAVYAVYRIYAVVYDGDPRYLVVLVTIATITMAVGVLGAVGESTTGTILIFNMVSGIGYVLLGVALFGPMGITAGMFYLVHHMVVMASLLLSTGAVLVTYGSQYLEELGGVARREPLLAAAFLGAAFSLAGVPPFSGFVAKFAVIRAAVAEGQYVAAATALVVGFVALVSVLKIWHWVFWGRMPKEGAQRHRSMSLAEMPRVRPVLIVPALLLTLISLGMGPGAEPVLAMTEQAAQGLVDTATYVEEVAGQ